MIGLLFFVLGILTCAGLHAYAVHRIYGQSTMRNAFTTTLMLSFRAAPHLLAVRVWNGIFAR